MSFIIDTNIDILFISETKLNDDSFSSPHFRLKGFCTPYRLDRNSKGGGLLLYFCEDIPSRFLNSGSTCNIETRSVEINLRKRKWLLTCCYNPNNSLISSHLDYLNNILDKYSKSYENLLFMGDFNVTMDDKFITDFFKLNGLSSLIDKPTCSENLDKPTCIDLILLNKPSYFQHSNVFETGLSDFYLLTVTEFKMGFQRLRPQVITYGNYKNIDNDKFQAKIKICGFDTNDISSFKEIILSLFNMSHPIKKKYIRANGAPFMTKNLHKGIMKWSRLRNKYFKSKFLTDRKNYNVRNF